MSADPAPRRRNATYYDGDLRHDLLEAARAAITEHGLSSLSLRDVARRVGVSHAAPAHHFVDKTGLFTALAADGFESFATYLDEVVKRTAADPTRVRLIATGVAYVEFAERNRASFEVMFRTDIFDTNNGAYLEAAARTFEVLGRAVREAQNDDWARGRDLDDVVLLTWSVGHGLATLRLSGALGRPDPAELDSLTLRLMNLLVDSLDDAK